MTRVRSATAISVVLVCMAAGCTGQNGPNANLIELSRAKAGSVDVILLSQDDAMKSGKDQVFLEFRSSVDQHFVDAGTVKVNATMQMAGMALMIGSTTVQRTDTAGRYALTTDLSMSGSWRIGVEWDGPAGHGTVSLPGTVR